MPQRVAEGRQPHRVARRGQQPRHRLARAAPFEPMTRHDGRRGLELGQTLRGLAMHLQPVVRRDLIDQGLAHELVPEAQSRAGQHQHASSQRGIEHREGVGLGVWGQCRRRGGIELVAGQRHPLQHRQRRVGHVAQARGDGFGHAGGQALVGTRCGAAREFDRGEGVAFGHTHDVRRQRVGQRTRRGQRNQSAGLVVGQRFEVDGPGHAGADQARHAAREGRTCRRRTGGQHHTQRRPGGHQVHQHIDIGVVDQVRIIDLQHDVAATGGGQQQPPYGTDHLVASQRSRQGGSRRRERAQQGQDRARGCAHAVEHAAVGEDEVLRQCSHQPIGTARLCGTDALDRPSPLAHLALEFAAERGLADAGGPAQDDAGGALPGGHR